MGAKFKPTLKNIEAVKKRGHYPVGNGLYLSVNVTGSKSWTFRYSKWDDRPGKEGKRRDFWLGLGPLRSMPLERPMKLAPGEKPVEITAREAALAKERMLREGRDPATERGAERAKEKAKRATALTFKQVAEQFYKDKSPEWKNPVHRGQWKATLEKYAYPKIGSLLIGDIDQAAVLRVLKPIWETRTVTAVRVCGRIEKVIGYAIVSGLRSGENPARWNGHLETLLPKPGKIKAVSNHPTLPYAEAPAFLADLRAREGIAERALEFLILTAARTGEVAGARWDEIDLAAATWTIPAERMKAGKPHRVPLPDRALEILRSLPRESEWVFVGTRRNGAIAYAPMAGVLIKGMGRTDIVVHGFRSTFRVWAAEKTDYQTHVIEMALAHAVGNKVEASYQRSDLVAKRRALMVDWERYLGKVSGVVVPIRARS